MEFSFEQLSCKPSCLHPPPGTHPPHTPAFVSRRQGRVTDIDQWQTRAAIGPDGSPEQNRSGVGREGRPILRFPCESSGNSRPGNGCRELQGNSQLRGVIKGGAQSRVGGGGGVGGRDI